MLNWIFLFLVAGSVLTAAFTGKMGDVTAASLSSAKSSVDLAIGLAVVGVLASAAGVYYYLRVVVYMYMRPAPDAAVLGERHWGTEAALVASSLAVVLFGILPGPIVDWLARGALLALR